MLHVQLYGNVKTSILSFNHLRPRKMENFLKNIGCLCCNLTESPFKLICFIVLLMEANCRTMAIKVTSFGKVHLPTNIVDFSNDWLHFHHKENCIAAPFKTIIKYEANFLLPSEKY